jgi:ABC-type nitrate/sulfonate/bicarbonate transport system permease component
VFAAILVLSTLGITFFALVCLLERMLLSWRFQEEELT